jgi:preprotein translocase subunit SecB
MMDTDKEAGISFDGIVLVKENFHRTSSMPNKSKIDIEFSMELNHFEDSFSNELTTNLLCFSDDGEEVVLKLEFTFVGLFSVNTAEENMDIKLFMKQNSPAIMFPYIREHISSITQKSGVSPVLLPPINIIAMTKDIKNNL